MNERQSVVLIASLVGGLVFSIFVVNVISMSQISASQLATSVPYPPAVSAAKAASP
jgi:hypothetical protein